MKNLQTAIFEFKTAIQKSGIISVVNSNTGSLLLLEVNSSNKNIINLYKKMLVRFAHKIKSNVAISSKGKNIMFAFNDEDITRKVRKAIE